MAKRRGGEEEGVSLFPFLSIVACIIGVLTLLISALSLAQMGSNDDIATYEKHEKNKRELDEIKKENERLEPQVSADELARLNDMEEMDRKKREAEQRMKLLVDEIVELRKLLAQLAQEVQVAEGGASKDGENKEAMRNQLARLKAEIERLQENLTAQKEQIAQLDKDLEERKKPPKESEFTVLPGGTGRGFEPVFVECAGGSIVIHQGEDLPRILAAELEQNDTYLRLLTQVAVSPKKTIVFLIRDNGLGTYRKARDLAYLHEAKNGKLPVIGKGRLNLSQFNQSR